MVENIAGSGLTLHHLQVIARRHGEDGLRDTFSAKNVTGQACVTATKRTLDEMIPKIVEFCKK